ncbi:MAG TPA: GAF domain-containing sensor histidine kinase [Acidimicrobiia bacterium]|jgi:signal transduction histidine kinase|nr:GAF domain-containing sensor histidine kinase [Acidimicrobiia bacterium]
MGRTTYARPAIGRGEPEPPIPLEGPVAGFALTAPGGDAAPGPARLVRDRHHPSMLELDHRLSTLVASLRWAAISLGLLTVAIKDPPRPLFLLAGLALATFGVAQTLRPVRLDPPGRALHAWVLVEAALVAAVVALTGGFTSPFVLASAVPVVLAGYAVGRRRMAWLGSCAFVTMMMLVLLQTDDPQVQRSVTEVGILLLLCGVLGAFTRHLVDELGLHEEAAWDQISRLTTANELLVALHGVAQSLPASLDLHEVVESSRTRLRSLFQFGALALLVHDDTRDEWTVELAEGIRLPRQLRDDMLAQPLREVLDHGRAVLETDLLSDGGDGRGCSPMARSGIYAPLRARGRTVGLIAIEDTTRARYRPDDVGLLTGLTGPLALAVDNALWFLRLRRFGAEAERARIARDLHDQLAQSLAYTAFELERLAIRAEGEDRRALDELHDVVRGVVGELRETLYQLRAGVSEDADLERVARDYLARYEERTGLAVHWRSRVERHLPYQVEQELWRMMQEALTNVEHHAEANMCTIDYRVSPTHVSLTVEDDGRGFEPARVDGDHYGLIGMRERADALGAHLVVESRPNQGTRVSVELEVPR